MNIDHFQSTAYSLSRKSCIHTYDILVGQNQKCWSKWTEEINVILLYINVSFYHLLERYGEAPCVVVYHNFWVLRHFFAV